MNLHELSGDSHVYNISFNEGFVNFIFEDYVRDRILIVML